MSTQTSMPLQANPSAVPAPAPATTRLFSFIAGETGPWRIERVQSVVGDTLATSARLSVVSAAVSGLYDGVFNSVSNSARQGAAWHLQGITSNERYVERTEKALLVSKQQGLGRPASSHAALIPIRKNADWWALTQDERRQIFEAQSQHIGIGMKYLPAIARKLHHCRDMGTDEPFDFLTWFEYAPADAAAFEDLLLALRVSPEWAYIDREVDIRLIRDDT